MAVTMTTDAAGGEVRVETGVGRIIRLTPKGERNVMVEIQADHLREETKCWVDRQGPVWPRVEAAHQRGMSIWYRIDVHRKDGVGPQKPVKDLTNREKIRDLVRVERPENAPASIEGAAKPAAAAAQPAAQQASAPPPAQPAQPAAAEPPAGPAAAAAASTRERSRDHALAQLSKALRSGARPEEISLLIDMATDLGATAQQIDAIADQARPAQPAAAAAQARRQPADLPADTLDGYRDPDRVAGRAPNGPVEETPPAAGAADRRPAMSQTSGLGRRASVASDARPWEATNSDGRLNLSSYAAGAVMDMVTLAGKLLVTRARARAESDPTYRLQPPGAQQLFGLAWQLLSIADAVQFRMRQGGRVDRMASSHKLARQSVREALDLYPVPWNADAETRGAWRDAMTEHAVTLVNVMLDLLDNRDRPSPPTASPASEPDAEVPAGT